MRMVRKLAGTAAFMLVILLGCCDKTNNGTQKSDSSSENPKVPIELELLPIENFGTGIDLAALTSGVYPQSHEDWQVVSEKVYSDQQYYALARKPKGVVVQLDVLPWGNMLIAQGARWSQDESSIWLPEKGFLNDGEDPTTKRGIHVGSTVADVRESYGMPFKDEMEHYPEGTGSYAYRCVLPHGFSGSWLAFSFQEGVVRAITMSLERSD